ncbi:hypothetical protein ATW7_16263 [Alteromonadales bacterium TW-7]|nr:hypothetical protein ATW7_16263 [Alteromonadales bacterium TW-7]
MPFKPRERVRFNKNPLKEVICQLTFVAKDEKYDTPEWLVHFHDLIRDKLPFLNKRNEVTVDVNTDTQSITEHQETIYEFSNLESTLNVTYDGQNVTCFTSDYTCKEDFFSVIELFRSSLMKIELNNNMPFSRVSLRYKDVIERSDLGYSKNEPWSSLLNERLTGAISAHEFSEDVRGFQSKLAIKLDSDISLNSTYGLIRNIKTEEMCFLIDCDFFIEGVINDDDVMPHLSRANEYARNFFQWCITEKLYQGLEPTKIE